ncbi:nuclear transport factor 2 family protein [Nonomuraea sp. NBC_00507]|uniref:nuclear transport factor 2 family protein n=1 Tax=Nonomuraea sp. NBC_00507 TaxID=2976002 RepID=UPI002E175D5A
MDTTLVDRYIAAWNETDADARTKAVAELWTEDATYTDPLADMAGHAGIAAVIEGAQGMFPGLVFSAGHVFEAHHNIARFTWHLGPAGGEPVAVGFDVVELAADGRIRKVLGFLDKVPTA